MRAREVWDVLTRHVPAASRWPLLRDLQLTELYARDAGFRRLVADLAALDRQELVEGLGRLLGQTGNKGDR